MRLDNINKFLKVVKSMLDFDKVAFIFLFGSVADGKQNKLSDIDFAVYYQGNNKERFKFRLEVLKKLPDSFDVQIFQDLPLFVQKEVLRGKLIYCKDKDLSFVYKKAYEVIKSYEDFKKGYYDYIGVEQIT